MHRNQSQVRPPYKLIASTPQQHTALGIASCFRSTYWLSIIWDFLFFPNTPSAQQLLMLRSYDITVSHFILTISNLTGTHVARIHHETNVQIRKFAPVQSMEWLIRNLPFTLQRILIYQLRYRITYRELGLDCTSLISAKGRGDEMCAPPMARKHDQRYNVLQWKPATIAAQKASIAFSGITMNTLLSVVIVSLVLSGNLLFLVFVKTQGQILPQKTRIVRSPL